MLRKRGAHASSALQWLLPLFGVVLGAAIGLWLHAANNNTTQEAASMIRIAQPIDPDQIITGNYNSSADLQQNFISGEVVFLTSPGFAETVAGELNQANAPKLSARQNGRSSLITLSADAPTFPGAERTVNAAIKMYTAYVQDQNRVRYQTGIDTLNTVIGELSSDAERNAARIDQLEAQRTTMEIQLRRPPGVEVVQPTIQSTHAFPSATLFAIAGGLFGGLVGLTATLGWRRYRSGTSSGSNAAAME
jgi:uncharacterized protein involved in exopolysaccharide biosynthesis